MAILSCNSYGEHIKPLEKYMPNMNNVGVLITTKTEFS